MNLVIVESPAKTKKIKSFLGKDYEVIASFGHIRDLVPKSGSVLPDEKFKMLWYTDSGKMKYLSNIISKVKKAKKLILATDPDREGEAIGHHILEVLKEKKIRLPVERITFNSITKDAVLEAIKEPRDVNEDMVNAYLARRGLDYLVGFGISPILWRTLPGSKSAGRVQSVALRLLCEREMERDLFEEEEFWIVTPKFKKGSNTLETELVKFKQNDLTKIRIPNKDIAKRVVKFLKGADWVVDSIKQSNKTRKPFAPFKTSTLQQSASTLLGFNSTRTMQTAQKLYEAGHITYMRTDSTNIVSNEVTNIRNAIVRAFGSDYVPEKPRFYGGKAKNAQEAHEAIRPTDIVKQTVNMGADHQRLYDMIWRRTMASQMADAKIENTVVLIRGENDGEEAIAKLTGSIIIFEGFLKVWGSKEEQKLPKLKEGEELVLDKAEKDQKFTQPPSRYNEASLVKTLEKEGIGRPSTYASIIRTLKDRGYAVVKDRQFVPSTKGRVTVGFLEAYFAKYVDYDFTARMEKRLDQIAKGEKKWRKIMKGFWEPFQQHLKQADSVSTAGVIDMLNEAWEDVLFPDGNGCPKCGKGELSLKISKHGAFVGCSKHPKCEYVKQLTEDADQELEEKPIGQDKQGNEITMKTGRYGPYLQTGTKDTALVRASIPKMFQGKEIDETLARKLLSLPRKLGEHKDYGDVVAMMGRFGPCIGSTVKIYATIKTFNDLFSITLKEAVKLLKEREKKMKEKKK